jgi:hypothetical protein
MRSIEKEKDYEILLHFSQLDDYKRFCDWAGRIDLDKEDYWLWLEEKQQSMIEEQLEELNEERMKE